MMTLDAVIRLVGLQEAELRRWIAEEWVRPERAGGGYVFREVDVARVQLIVELRHDLAIDEEALPVVLHLLDQVYGLRRRLRSISQALEGLPPELRKPLRARLGLPAIDED